MPTSPSVESSGRCPRRALHRRRRRGFTFVELLVALILVDVALLALVATAALVRREIDAAAWRTNALAAAGRTLDRLASQASSDGASTGEASPRADLRERWTVASEAAGTRVLADSVHVTTGIGTRVLVLRTRARC